MSEQDERDLFAGRLQRLNEEFAEATKQMAAAVQSLVWYFDRQPIELQWHGIFSKVQALHTATSRADHARAEKRSYTEAFAAAAMERSAAVNEQ